MIKKLGTEERQILYENFIIKLLKLGWSIGAIGDELAIVAQALENLQEAEKFD